uniref:Pre-mRNA-splicing factor 38 n=1 Tax=Timema bartmani TaxID=61472 RepID=A0A7R9I2A6_9NEOP|nr:unnamed protein product [Timema bartmani]
MEHFDSEGSQWGNNSSPGAGDEEKKAPQKFEKKNNSLPLWGNERTMNLNPLILTNIQSSHYFKVNLYELKTYHEVIDEIYYKVTHLEPWEKGSRKTAGQTGMCGGLHAATYLCLGGETIPSIMAVRLVEVAEECEEFLLQVWIGQSVAYHKVRGVGAGGIVSTAYCLLYKLFTLKLTRKQINGLITHPDSPYIRGLGFMYISIPQAQPLLSPSLSTLAIFLQTSILTIETSLLAIIPLPVSLPLGGKVIPRHTRTQECTVPTNQYPYYRNFLAGHYTVARVTTTRRYTQPPADLWDWYDQYLEDPEVCSEI